MKFSFLAVSYGIATVMSSGVVSALTPEVIILCACFLLGGLTAGPPWSEAPGRIRELSS
jgi:hypothetical protein